MKVLKTLLPAAGIIILLSPLSLFAEDRHREPADHYLTMTCFVNPLSLGCQHHLGKRFYATADVDYLGSEKDLEMRTGAVLAFPVKILFFHFYGGGGVQFSRDQGYQYPYLSIGTRFLFFYSELIHPWREKMSPSYRFGFSFSF